MSTTNTTTLAERVYWAISDETPIGCRGAMHVLHDYPDPPTEARELDLIDWGFTYGVAYALAMLDADRFEPTEGPAIRAGEAAREAYARQHGVAKTSA